MKRGSGWKWVLLFVGFPLLELWLILKLSAAMGWIMTLWLILMTGVIGGSLAYRQGFATIHKIQTEMGQGRMPAQVLFEGLLILIAGLVLVTPGIITDMMGFSLLIPPVRRFLGTRLQRLLKHKFGVSNASRPHPSQGMDDDDVIDV